MEQPPTRSKNLTPLAWITVVVVVGAVSAVVLWIFPQIGSDDQSTQVVTNSNGSLGTNTSVDTAANGNVSSNGSSSANLNSEVNSNSNANTSNTSNGVPAGWTTYSSSTASLGIFRQLNPPFAISYPADWNVDEQLGGLFISDEPFTGLEPSIAVSASSTVLSEDILGGCKGENTENIYDQERLVNVGGIQSAYLAFRLPETIENNNQLDSILICVPHANGSYRIVGQPRDSQFVQEYFDAILSTFTLDLGEGSS